MATPGVEAGDDHLHADDSQKLSEAEKELIREELKKTEDEIATLKQVLNARQKHVATLKRKLGISPIAEITTEVSHGLKAVQETPAYQKTSEVVAHTAETVANKWQDMRNSSLFKSFESKLGSAYTNAKMAASTSIDHLAGAARGGNTNGTVSPNNEQPTSPLS
ncbi:tumor protein D52 family protein [Aphelenchoides avenae]|nr:tumor protein D52 family protein [Aphelenchus avenae]